MNIHYYAGDRLTAADARRRGLTIGSSKGTQTPRTRSNLDTKLPHNAYPGGKRLRKAMAELKRRTTGIQHGHAKRPDRISSRDDMTPWGSYGFTKPGSMRG